MFEEVRGVVNESLHVATTAPIKAEEALLVGSQDIGVEMKVLNPCERPGVSIAHVTELDNCGAKRMEVVKEVNMNMIYGWGGRLTVGKLEDMFFVFPMAGDII